MTCTTCHDTGLVSTSAGPFKMDYCACEMGQRMREEWA